MVIRENRRRKQLDKSAESEKRSKFLSLLSKKRKGQPRNVRESKSLCLKIKTRWKGLSMIKVIYIMYTLLYIVSTGKK